MNEAERAAGLAELSEVAVESHVLEVEQANDSAPSPPPKSKAAPRNGWGLTPTVTVPIVEP